MFDFNCLLNLLAKKIVSGSKSTPKDRHNFFRFLRQKIDAFKLSIRNDSLGMATGCGSTDLGPINSGATAIPGNFTPRRREYHLSPTFIHPDDKTT